MSGRNFSLTGHLSSFVDRQVASGRHQNASEAVREALRRCEDDILAEPAALAAIERGDFVLVRTGEESRALLAGLNERAASGNGSKGG